MAARRREATQLTVTTDALAVRLTSYAETSAVLVLLTESHGSLHALAKGAKRTSNSFLGPLDKCVLYRVRVAPRKGDRLGALHSATVREAFPRLRTDPPRFHAAILVLEVAADLLREDEPHPEFFKLTVFTLKVLDRAPHERLGLAVALFLARAVRLSGHVPELDSCLICGEPALQEGRPLFSPTRGGVLHPACGRGEPGARSIEQETLILLRSLWNLPAARLLEHPNPPAALVRELRLRLVDWLQQTLERRFRAATAADAEISWLTTPRG